MKTEFYARLSRPFEGRPRRIAFLRIFSQILTFPIYALYIILLIFLAVNDLPLFWRTVAVTGVGFVGVTVWRRVANVPRRYEVTGIPSLLGKTSKGESFPSRHLYSVFVIGTAAWQVWPVVGAITYGMGVLMAVVRVVGGVHYVRDVLVGAAVGLAVGWIGFLLPFR